MQERPCAASAHSRAIALLMKTVKSARATACSLNYEWGESDKVATLDGVDWHGVHMLGFIGLWKTTFDSGRCRAGGTRPADGLSGLLNQGRCPPAFRIQETIPS